MSNAIAVMRIRTAEKVNDKYLIDADEYNEIKKRQAQIYLAEIELEELRAELDEYKKSYCLVFEKAIRDFFKRIKAFFKPKKLEWKLKIQEDDE